MDNPSTLTTMPSSDRSIQHSRSHPLQLARRRGGGKQRYRAQVPRGKRPTSIRSSVSNMKVSDAAYLAQKAWSAVKMISTLINVEEKLFDVASSVNPSSTGNIINLSNIAEGSDYNNRDGLSILTQSLTFNTIMTKHASAVNTFLRVILFRDNDQRGTDPAVTDVLETASVIAPIMHFSANRFTIVDDKMFVLTDSSATALQSRSTYKLNKHIYFNNTTGVDASNYEGALYALILSDQATNTPTIAYYSRLAFTDN